MKSKGQKRVLALVMAATLMSSQFMETGTITVQAEEETTQGMENEVENVDETESSGTEESSVEESSQTESGSEEENSESESSEEAEPSESEDGSLEEESVETEATTEEETTEEEATLFVLRASATPLAMNLSEAEYEEIALSNGDFESTDVTNWDITFTSWENATKYTVKTNTWAENNTTYFLYLYNGNDDDNAFSASYTVFGLEAGNYYASIDFEGMENASSGLSFSVADKNGNTLGETETITTGGWGVWTVTSWANWDTGEITGIRVKEGDTVEIGAQVIASACAWGTLDEFVLYRAGDLTDEPTTEPGDEPAEDITKEEAGNGSSTDSDNADSDLNLASAFEKVVDFAEGFDTYHLQPVQEAALSYQSGLNMQVGVEYAGKTAYLFSKNLVTGVYQLSKIMTVSEIGNVGMYTNEMTDVMVLIAK